MQGNFFNLVLCDTVETLTSVGYNPVQKEKQSRLHNELKQLVHLSPVLPLCINLYYNIDYHIAKINATRLHNNLISIINYKTSYFTARFFPKTTSTKNRFLFLAKFTDESMQKLKR